MEHIVYIVWMMLILLIAAAVLAAMFLAVAQTLAISVDRRPVPVARLFAPMAWWTVLCACLRDSDRSVPRAFRRERRADSGRPAKVRKVTKVTNLLTFADPPAL